ncbi:MAG TPA: DNA repair protein RadC [Firmicutes bacterium]|jgi:DNA repair protein RadC|nr:DNA repair protein RadC [Bacillota bacterium]
MVPEYHLTIKDLPLESRPRERLVKLGAQALSTSELIALLLGTGSRTETALQLAQRLLAGNCRGWHGSGLRALQDASVEELSKIHGVGVAKAARIKAALELGRRLVAETRDSRPVIKSPQAAAALVMEEMRYLDREHFRVLLLSTKNHVIAIETDFVGSLNSSLVHPRELFRTCIRRSAAAIILIHNHPSGDPTPSQEDIQLTHRLCEGGALLGIDILDHLIIGDGIYVSMREKGII